MFKHLLIALVIISSALHAKSTKSKKKISETPVVAQEPVLPAAPIDNGPAPIVLTEKQQKMLEAGKAVFPPIQQEADGTGGAATAVFRVKASPSVIWKVIEDFDQYKNWVDGVYEAKRYDCKNKHHTCIEFQVGKFFTPTYTYHINHNYSTRDRGFGTWVLDADKKNDLTDSTGYWRVTAMPNDPNECTVEYSVNLRADGIMLKLVRPILLKSGVKDATSWVKKQAELEMTRQPK